MSSINEILGSEEIKMQRFDYEPAMLSRREALKERWTVALEYIRSTSDRINRSTFGRVFRLKGCGHVRSITSSRPRTLVLTTAF